ncbi:metallophosphoesterase family protein [Desulfohalobium retbaense]|uniref:Metallophosphoesterase n=1 Tax=Desulfohalobium retbaense (strain ATCC 49708 / DSM 5692 / JCM 16813 / HR100) TaxID=485915 RepID=C8X5X7_DESRD|nr:metallophosphoesterase family protein [Desulfohalobium retbaense]ACV69824.1 metallophosphoesterase [Desulfohalobium retbaense DSM 5692]
MLLFYADAHGNFEELISVARKYHSEIKGIFLLGDQSPGQPLDQELKALGSGIIAKTYFILGNHDLESKKYIENHFCIWQNYLNKRTIDIDGICIGGFSSTYSEKSIFFSNNNKTKYTIDTLKSKEPLCCECLSGFSNMSLDILITHEAPSNHPEGCYKIDEAARLSQSSIIIHGHHHEDYESSLPFGTRIIGLGRQQVLYFTADMLTNNFYF